MGRPPLPKDQKRQQVNIRLNPEDRVHLEEMASRQGAALAATAESVLADAIESDRQAGDNGPTPQRREAIARIVLGTNSKRPRDDETLSLLADIAEQIDVIQEMTRKRWHKDRRTWAAVAQMLTKGPIIWSKVDDPSNDEELKNNALDGWAIRELKRRKIEAIASAGVVVHQSRFKHHTMNALLGLGNAFAKSNREDEQAIIDAIPDETVRLGAQQVFAELLELDEQESENEAQFSELYRPFSEEEVAGRNLYSEHRRELSAAAKEAGEPYIFEDLR